MKKDFALELPFFTIQWHVTGLCDQSCLHCYMVNDPEAYRRELAEELSGHDCRRIIDSLVSFSRLAEARPGINFTGGDPLLRPDFFDILSYAQSKGVTTAVLGNPFHLNTETVSAMMKLGVRSYQVSLDGMEVIHDSFRKPGSFSATIEAIKLLKVCGMRTVVMFTLSKQNRADLFPVMRLVDSLGVDAFAFARLSRNPVIDANLPLAEGEFKPEEYRNLLLGAQSLAKELKAKGSKTHFTLKDHLWKLLLWEQGRLKLETNPKRRVISGCHMGERGLNLLADGTVFACRRFNSPVGKMPEQSVLEVFTSDTLDHYRQIEKLEKCAECPLLYHCRGCPSVAYGVSGGNFYSPDPQCWRISR